MFNFNTQKNKVISFALALLICAVNLGVVTSTNAYYSDKETSKNNTFVSKSLDLVIDKKAPFTEFQMFGATTTSDTVVVSDNGETPFSYRTSAVTTSCNATFLSDTTMTVKRSGMVVYRGAINAFTIDTLGTTGTWTFAFLLNGTSNTPQDAHCKLDIKFLGWDKKFPSPGLGGFSDTETYHIDLTASGVVLNEILSNPEGPDGLSRPFGEWVELYNNSSSNVDLTGWYIKDAAGNTVPVDAAHDLFGRTTIFARGSALFTSWLVVFMNGEILDNTGDTVYLYDNLGRVRDQYSFGTHANDANLLSHITPGYNNNSPLVGSEIAGREGKSDARMPDGYGVWVDPVPTPGGPNELEGAFVVPIPTEVNTATTTGTTTVDKYANGTGSGSSSGPTLNQTGTTTTPIAEETKLEVRKEDVVVATSTTESVVVPEIVVPVVTDPAPIQPADPVSPE